MNTSPLDVSAEIKRDRASSKHSDTTFIVTLIVIFVLVHLFIGALWLNTLQSPEWEMPESNWHFLQLLPLTIPVSLIAAGVFSWINGRRMEEKRRKQLQELRERVRDHFGILLEVPYLQRAWEQRQTDLVRSYGALNKQRVEVDLMLDRAHGLLYVTHPETKLYGGENL